MDQLSICVNPYREVYHRTPLQVEFWFYYRILSLLWYHTDLVNYVKHKAYISPNSSCQMLLSFRTQHKPASAIEGVPSNPRARWSFLLWFSTSHFFALRMCSLGCCYGSWQPSNWFPLPLYPAAGELNRLKCKSDDVTLGLKTGHWLPTQIQAKHLQGPQVLYNPPPWMLFPHSILQAGLWLLSPYSGCFCYQNLLILSWLKPDTLLP